MVSGEKQASVRRVVGEWAVCCDSVLAVGGWVVVMLLLLLVVVVVQKYECHSKSGPNTRNADTSDEVTCVQADMAK